MKLQIFLQTKCLARSHLRILNYRKSDWFLQYGSWFRSGCRWWNMATTPSKPCHTRSSSSLSQCWCFLPQLSDFSTWWRWWSGTRTDQFSPLIMFVTEWKQATAASPPVSLIGRVNSVSSSFPLPAGSCWKLAISTVLRHGLGWQNLALDYRKRKFGGVHLSNFQQIHTCFLISVWLNNIFQVGSNFTWTMNELKLDQLCKCFCKSFWVYTLLCAHSDSPAYVLSYYPTSTFQISVHSPWQPLDPAGLTSPAARATLEGTKHSLIQSKGSCLMPPGPQFVYKQFFPGCLYFNISVFYEILCNKVIHREEGSGQNWCSSAILYLGYD